MLREDTVTDDGRCAVMEFTVFGWNGKVWEDPATYHAGLAWNVSVAGIFM